MFNFLSKILLIALVFSTPASALFTDHNSLPENKEIVVLLHGLGRNKTSMWLLASRLEDAGYYVKRVEYSSLDQNPDEILQDISSQIYQCCQKHTHSVHFVGHSLGGLMVRAYLQYNKVDKLGKVVLLGTPNKGAEAADHFSNSWLMEILGPTAKALGTGENSFPNSLKAPYYPVGIIAGEINNKLNDPVIPGKDDGLVSVEATKIDGMTDFIIIETGHSSMRYNSEVAEQTIEFIKNGMFKTK
ncbi:MAG: alpha/beta hydrolase [Candidatus Thiodiazotropha sp. (ex Ctena orbiculata)]|nr:alpha/beta hydrolase [Candidatus Thiodiazotropha taylori]